MESSEYVGKYFEEIEKEIDVCYGIADDARKKGLDPESKVDIPLAKGISERVEGLISAVMPQVLKSGIAERIVELEEEYGSLDWRVALKIAEEVARQKFCKFESDIKAMETGIRIGLAYITLGVISAPLEGFIELKLKKRNDGNGEFFSVFYAGPIRAAGGTASAVSTIIADFVRLRLGYKKFDPSEDEVKRYVTELRDYHERVSNLQYYPSEQEIEFMARHLPLEINGDPTEKLEVSNYKDLPRIATNRIRGGMCLVFAEGLSLKAPKLFKRLNKWGKDMGLEWEFMEEFLALQKKIKSKGKGKGTGSKGDSAKLKPNFTFIKDLVAGRPILTYPMAEGGFRLRYGRTRTTGLAAAAIHPATMVVLQKYIATGTQLKMERPGKAAAISPCDNIDGPIVKLRDGTVLILETEALAKQKEKEIETVLFLGDILFNYGDFSENGHKLVPVGYCEEWWLRELEKEAVDRFGCLDLEKLSTLISIKSEHIQQIFDDPAGARISYRLAKNISDVLAIPLHPYWTYHWKALSKEEILGLIEALKRSTVKKAEDEIVKLISPNEEKMKNMLERIGIPHLLVNNEYIVIEKDHARSIYDTLSLDKDKKEIALASERSDSSLSFLKEISGMVIRDKSGTFIGARMGRPEKAKMRKLAGSPHVLFPIGEEGGRLRCFQSAIEAGKVGAEFPSYRCKRCARDTIYRVCEICGEMTVRQYFCKQCGTLEQPCSKHGSSSFSRYDLDIRHYFSDALKKIGAQIYPDLIKGVKGTSNKDHTPEHLMKGIIRAKHGIYVNKDGTTRYDMIEMPITHFKPSEINASIERLKSIGYEHDIKGRPLISKDQVVEIFPQDIILPNCPDSPDDFAETVLFKVANAIDEMLVKLYGLKPYYQLKEPADLIGQLIIGLAPHTSAGIVGRIAGFSKTQGMYTHPLYHAAMRRNCDGDEACALLLLDGLLNFSRSYLPDRRGSRTMDAPLVLTSILVPKEVDDEVHGMDIVWEYPLELYEASLNYKNPWDVSVLQIADVLGKPKQYEYMGFTHKISDINIGVTCSSYKTLPSMQDKLAGQMDIAEKLRAVDESDVARLVIEKHFIKDIKGNLRKYSQQQFRCVKCNQKFRRPPLSGKCTGCGGKLIFTISPGSIIKYLEPSLSLCKKYSVSPYLKQTLELTKRRIEAVLGKAKEKQEALGKWFG